MPTVDLTEPGKNFTTAIQTGDEKSKRLNTLIATMYQGSANMNQRRLITMYREEYQGIDSRWSQTFALDENRDASLTMAGLTSMMVYNFSEIVASRYYNTFVSDTGEYVRVLPERISAIEDAKALTHLINYYLRQNKKMKQTFYEIFRGVARDGVAVTEQCWNYKNTTQRITKQPRQRWDSKTKAYEEVNDVTVKKTIKLIDRPEIRYIDPLMFGMPPGAKTLDVDSRMCNHKEVFTRGQLLALEKRGFLTESFSSLTKTEVGDLSSSSAEAPEMKMYYRELFSNELNEKLEWDDPEYKLVVDKLYVAASEDEDIMSYWFVNGQMIRSANWEGGHEIPYKIHTFTPVDTTWMGMGIAEIIQDYYREDNILTKSAVTIARKAGKVSLLIPRTENLTQADIGKLTSEGGVVQYDDAQDGVPYNQKVIQYNLGAPLESLIKPRDDVRQQAAQVASIAIPEIAGADLPSAMRSDKLMAGLGSQSGRPAQMKVSLMGESLGDAYEQIKTLIYRLQDEPVEIYLGDKQQPMVKISPDIMETLPDTQVVPNIYAKKLSSDMFQILVQMLPYIQAVSTPAAPQEAYNFGKVLDTVLESALGPEEALKVFATKGTGGPATFTDMAQEQKMSTQGNGRSNNGAKPMGM